MAGDAVSQFLDGIVSKLRIDMRMEQEQIHPVKPATIDPGLRGEFEHPVKRYWGMVGSWFLTNQTGPHRVVKFHFTSFDGAVGHESKWRFLHSRDRAILHSTSRFLYKSGFPIIVQQRLGHSRKFRIE
jgi:hypothetical protein